VESDDITKRREDLMLIGKRYQIVPFLREHGPYHVLFKRYFNDGEGYLHYTKCLTWEEAQEMFWCCLQDSLFRNKRCDTIVIAVNPSHLDKLVDPDKYLQESCVEGGDGWEILTEVAIKEAGVLGGKPPYRRQDAD